MFDFLKIRIGLGKNKQQVIYPSFVYCKSKDLMTRGGDFYAIWNEETNLWSTDEDDAVRLIDNEIKRFYESQKDDLAGAMPLYLKDTDSGMVDKWHKFVQKQLRDNYVPLDSKIIFSNHKTVKEDYATRVLPYPLVDEPTPNYDHMMNVLYGEEERRKLEWAIGAIISGNSINIQKFLVLYGAPSTGKSTVLHIIEDLFEGYCVPFDAKTLGSSSDSFALEAFKTNPLVAIQHDGDLSRIEDNTRLNSIVSHEAMTINAKYSKLYSMAIRSFLFLGTNKPVKITDAKSGLLRRLIDVNPTGNRIPRSQYDTIISKIKFEHGGIAYHCLQVYEDDPSYYDNYIPTGMLGSSNDFYNFILEYFSIFAKDDSTTLKAAWEMYKTYCDEAKVPYPQQMRIVKEELKNYFREFQERGYDQDGLPIRNVYTGFLKDKFTYKPANKSKESTKIILKDQPSKLDKFLADCKAQYGEGEKESPVLKWDKVDTKLKDINTRICYFIFF